jgi:hypothetical protein
MYIAQAIVLPYINQLWQVNNTMSCVHIHVHIMPIARSVHVIRGIDLIHMLIINNMHEVATTCPHLVPLDLRSHAPISTYHGCMFINMYDYSTFCEYYWSTVRVYLITAHQPPAQLPVSGTLPVWPLSWSSCTSKERSAIIKLIMCVYI